MIMSSGEYVVINIISPFFNARLYLPWPNTSFASLRFINVCPLGMCFIFVFISVWLLDTFQLLGSRGVRSAFCWFQGKKETPNRQRNKAVRVIILRHQGSHASINNESQPSYHNTMAELKNDYFNLLKCQSSGFRLILSAFCWFHGANFC